MTPPAYARTVPLPPEPGQLLWDDDRFQDRAQFDEWNAPFLVGAVSTKQYQRSKILAPVSFLCYPSTVKTIRDPQLKCKPPKGGKRGAIDCFSDKARRKLRFTAVNAFPALSSMFVATYPEEFPQDGRKSKKHLQLFLDNFRKKYPSVPYLWVLEFQGRGAPHYHFFSSLAVNPENRKWLASTWVRIGCGNSEDAMQHHMHQRSFIPWDMGNGSYICKYLDKARQKDVPDGYTGVGRFWGSSRGLVPEPIMIEVQGMTAALGDTCHKPVTRTCRALVRYHQKVTTWWGREGDSIFQEFLRQDENEPKRITGSVKKVRNIKRDGRKKQGLKKLAPSKVRSGRSLYSFSVVSGKSILLNMVKYFERGECGRSSFKQWSSGLDSSRDSILPRVASGKG